MSVNRAACRLERGGKAIWQKLGLVILLLALLFFSPISAAWEVPYDDAEPEVPLSDWWVDSVYPTENSDVGLPSGLDYSDFWPIPGEDWGTLPDVLMFTVSPATPKLYWLVGTADYYTGSGWARTTSSSQVDSFPQRAESVMHTFDVEFNTSSPKVSLPIPQHRTNLTDLKLDPQPSELSLYLDETADMYGIEAPGLQDSVGVNYRATYAPAASPTENLEYSSSIIDMGAVPEEIRQLYLQLPDGLPQEVRDLAENLRDPSLSTIEQILADVAYLKSNFSYDTGAAPGAGVVRNFEAEGDVGDNFSAATLISPGTGTGYLGVDHDFFKVYATTGSEIKVTLSPTYFNLRLYSPGGYLLVSSTEGSISATAASYGYHYIEVYGDWSGAYVLSVSIESRYENLEAAGDAEDTFENATEISLGTVGMGSLSGEDYVDHYKVYVTSGLQLTITLTSLSRVYLYCYAPKIWSVGGIETQEDAVGSLTYTATSSGYFYIQVYGEGTYKLSISTVPITLGNGQGNLEATGDAGDTFQAATEISSGTAGTGQANVGDYDYFKIYVAAGSRLDITMDVLSADSTYFYFYDPGRVGRIYAHENTNGSFTHTAISSGYFYISIYSWGGSGTYWLSVSETKAQNFEAAGDAGDDFSTATEISPSTGTGNVVIDFDDFFKIYLLAWTELTITLTPPSEANFDLRLYDTNQYQLAYTTLGEITTTITSSGYYYIRVYRRNGSGTYTLNVFTDLIYTGGDWVLYFIQRGRGKCMDFSTALAVILRLQGIPSRVNFGFKPGPVVGDKVLYLSSGGHSETEAYLPPYGWVRFDATPSVPTTGGGAGGAGTGDGDWGDVGNPPITDNQTAHPENQPSLTATQLDLTINPENATRPEHRAVSFSVHLGAASAPLADKQVRIWDALSNEEIATLTTDSSGYAYTSKIFGETDPLGEHYITASFSGDKTYKSSSDTGIFLLYSPTTLTMDLSSSTVRRGEQLRFEGELKDDLGVGVSGKSILITLDTQPVGGSAVTTGVGGKYWGSITVGADVTLGYHELQAKFEP